ncbi:adenylyltransferase and sulfurtransferase [Georgenia satyanarayanai]|uniref:Adenylyltransferase and sulfurtransferase n=1 Tax=Georgenia satyanarayanai TaxID=860221 RepID=A0A2Y9A4W6_9MICO|nr:ThiF family adenylyltransferase [Georgenia satyanarayanai]PYG01026.1 adenylyltransferase/sulfurtransferase [Georgenia satyanarayanai]SSA39265.1 adenylyltransferase and sulfurtransferase [Georgenia satyanarayanai]
MPLPPLVPPGPPLEREQVLRYSRHLLLEQLGETGQRRLRAARVLVMGAGGLGSPILHYLAAAGVGHLGIVDDDVVEATNLQRQVLHTTADVGRPKVDSAAEHVRALNADVAVTRHHLRLDATNAREVIAGYDLVLDGTDNFPTRYLVADVCADLGLPLVWGSILRFDAQVAVFWSRPPREAGYPAVTLRDLFPAPPPPGATPSCGQAGVLGAMCGQVGSLMAAEAVKLVTGAGEPLLGRVAVLDVLAARWSELPLRPRPRPSAPSSRAELGYDPLGLPVTAHAAAVLAAEPAPAVDDDGPTLTARELAERLAARERGEDDFVLLDVREPTERAIVQIPGAVTVPLERLVADPRAAEAAGVGPGAAVVVHCLSGGRSAQAQGILRGAGYADVTNLAGGVRAWVADVDPSLPVY